MKNYLNSLKANPLLTGSALMIFGSNSINAINYIYHLVMGRLLGPVSYGELTVLLSLLGFLGMIPGSFGLVLVKWVSAAKTQKEVGGIKRWFISKIILFTGITLLIILFVTPLITSFLHIQNQMLVILIGLVFLFSIPTLLYKSILQGMLKFKELLLCTVFENSIKLIGGVVLVILGFSVGGALSGLLAAGFFGVVLAKYFSDKFIPNNIHDPDFKAMLKYSLPVLLQSAAFISLFSADLILVKHFFSGVEAGIYASVSTLGKIIFFASGPIGSAMFPIVSKRQSSGVEYRKIFLYSLLATVLMACFILFVYWLTPSLAVNILYGNRYINAASLVFNYGIYMTLLTISVLFINYFLSIGKTKLVFIEFIAAVIQIIAILEYHQTLQTVILVSVIDSSLMLSAILSYFLFFDISVHKREVQ